MNAIERALTDALDAAAESVRPGTVIPLPERDRVVASRRWPAWFTPVLAAVVVMITVVGALVVPRLVIGAGTPARHGPPAAHAAGPPRFYAIFESVPSCGNCISIRATSTGATVTTVPAILYPNDARRLLAYGITTHDDRTFYVVYQGTGSSMVCYRLVLSARGAKVSFAPAVRLTLPPRELPFYDPVPAVSPDGSRLAIAGMIGGTSRQAILVLDLRTGRVATWHNLDRPGARTTIADVSWTAGNSLVYLAQVCRPALALDCGGQVREIGAPGDGGSLASGRLLFATSATYPGISQAQISADGSELIALVRWRETVKVVVLDVATGAPRRELFSAPLRPGQLIDPLDPRLRTDASGQYILFSGWIFVPGAPTDSAGWLHDGRIHSLLPAESFGVPVAW